VRHPHRGRLERRSYARRTDRLRVDHRQLSGIMVVNTERQSRC
jgi:hypothetical protein